jgi:molybdenum cofactor biosynthesis protein B
MSAEEHQRKSVGTAARCAVVTLSDTRTRERDQSGDRIVALLGEANHKLAERALIRDEPLELAALLDQWLYRQDVDCVITTGGTGVGARDRTISVVRERLALELPGFGEIFRALSFEQVGPPAMLSRAVAGISGGPNPSALFALPGSVQAVELAMQRLIVPVLPHLLWQMRQ